MSSSSTGPICPSLGQDMTSQIPASLIQNRSPSLRRWDHEIGDLKVEDIQQREEYWVIADLVGNGGHIRTVPVPVWDIAGIDACTAASGIASGILIRSINKAGRVWGVGFSPKAIWGVAKEKAKDCEIPALAPHDLRRTCAGLCHQAGGELEQIQFLLGHDSVQTAERYLGRKQRFSNAVDDQIGLEPDLPALL